MKPLSGDPASFWYTERVHQFFWISMGDLWAELNQEMVASKLWKYQETTVDTFHYVIVLTLGLCFYLP